MNLLWFLAGAIIGPIVLVWMAKRLPRRQHTAAPKTDPTLTLLLERLTLIANNPDEPRAAKIAQKTLKDITPLG